MEEYSIGEKERQRMWRGKKKSVLIRGQPIRNSRDPIEFHVMRYCNAEKIGWEQDPSLCTVVDGN